MVLQIEAMAENFRYLQNNLNKQYSVGKKTDTIHIQISLILLLELDNFHVKSQQDLVTVLRKMSCMQISSVLL